MNRNDDRTPWKAPHPLGLEARLFKLDEALTAGGSADAKYRYRNEDAEDWENEATATMRVHDGLNGFEGDSGTNGIAVRIGRYWVVVQLMCDPEA